MNFGLLICGYNGKRIFALQKKVITLIMNQKYNAHTDPLFKKLNILKCKDIFELCQLEFYNKYMNHELPLYFQDMNSEKYKHYFTRNRHKLYKCKIKHDFARKSLR